MHKSCCVQISFRGRIFEVEFRKMLCESDEMEIDLMEYHQLSDEESRVKTMMSTLDVMATLTKTRQSQQKYVC